MLAIQKKKPHADKTNFFMTEKINLNKHIDNFYLADCA